MTDKPDGKSWAKTAVIALLAPFAFLSGLLVVVPLLLFVGASNATVYGVYWTRWKFTGEPIPLKACPPPSVNPPGPA